MRMSGLLLVVICLVAGGCSSYVTPGRGGDMQLFTGAGAGGASPAEVMKNRPTATFPANLAIARIQAPDYRTRTAQGHGRGSYSVVFTRDVERDDQLAAMEKLPMIRGVAPLGRLVVPAELHSDVELRNAAARLGADILLIYTFDTAFFTDERAMPLSVISLGLSPTKNVRVTTTASAIFLDTRSGFVYEIGRAHV